MTLRPGPSLADWLEVMAMIPTHGRRRLWKAEHRGLVDQPCELFRTAAADAPADDRLAFAQYVDYQTYLPCDILNKVDVASMCHGLEVRTPLVDVRVLDLARRLPPAQRFTRNGTGHAVGKPLLRRLLAGRLPDEIVCRPKQGFAIPRDRWFMPGGPARALFEQTVGDSTLGDWFDMGAVRALLDSHGPIRDQSNSLWLLLVLAIWRQQNPEVSFA
jgi:asparagine synthase (glutamine-hydrolysing)